MVACTVFLGALVIPCGILTISDRASLGVYEDKSGPAIQQVFTRWIASPWEAVTRLVPDEQPLIEAAIRELVLSATTACTADEADAVVTIRNEFKQRGTPIVDADRRGVPVLVLKSNASEQLERAPQDLYSPPHYPHQSPLPEA